MLRRKFCGLELERMYVNLHIIQIIFISIRIITLMKIITSRLIKSLVRHRGAEPFVTRGTLKQDKRIMVWGCFTAHGVGNIHWIKGIMDQHIYKQVLIYNIDPSIQKLYPDGDYIFQHDNGPKHTTNSLEEYLRNKGREPTENLWSILACIQDRTCKTQEELFEVVKTAWEAPPIDTLSNLVGSD
jgi:hypothetical protein